MKLLPCCVLAIFCLSAGLAGAGTAPGDHPAQKPASVTRSASKVRNITVVAIENKISPDVIRVRRGDLVRLTFKAKDGTYGVKIPALGVKGKATPDRPIRVEFAATSEGEYEMRFTKFWSVRHWSKNGKIVVE
jgi:heme/copper-type cytochrome/quinol oxidase subunit 2